MLALNKELLVYFENIFIKREVIKLDTKLEKFIKYVQLPIVISTHQDNKYKDIRLAKQGGHHFKIVNKITDEELVMNTRLKLMLVDKFSMQSYRILNINDNYEKLTPKYVGTYLNKMGKDKAQKHIKALLFDAKWIKIIDSYIDSNTSQWNENKNLLEQIIPFGKFDLKIESGSIRDRRQPISKDKQNDLNAICSDWEIGAIQYNDNTKHDRYIETDKLKILLSGGLYNLSSSSNKDFTYVIEIK